MSETSERSITHRRVLRIAVPIVLSNATVPILGAVDTGVVGQIGLAAPIGAVGIGAIILSTVYWFFGFLRMGISGMTSQARGQGDTAEVSVLLSRCLLIGITAGLAIVLLQVPIFRVAIWIAPASNEVERLASDYVSVRIFSAPAAIATFGITGWLIALERTRSVLVLQVAMNSINIVLDLVFVLGLGWGVRGVAFASLIAEMAGFALGLWLCRDAFACSRWHSFKRILDAARLKRMASINADIIVRTLLLEAAFVSFLFLAADFGDVTLAANQILLQFLHITAYALDGFAFSAEALVGLSVGARTRATLRRSVKFTSFWAAVSVVILAACFYLFGTAVIDFMTTASDVRTEAKSYLAWVVIAPIVGAPAWMLDGIFIGATRTKDMRNGMIVSFLIYAASLMLLVPYMENHGIWLSMSIMFISRAVTLSIRYAELENSANK